MVGIAGAMLVPGPPYPGEPHAGGVAGAGSGPFVEQQAPSISIEVVEALSSVKVEAGSGETQSGFELTFELPARSPASRRAVDA